MKPTLLSAILILFLLQSASAQSKSKPILISGSIRNLTLDSIVVRNVIDNSMKKIGINKDGSFKGSVIFSEGYYNLSFQNEYTNIYLKPGFDLKISADMENLDGTISYSGEGSNENNYLSKKLLAVEEFKKSNPAFMNEPLSELDFLKKTSGLYDTRKNLLLKTTGLGDDFKYLEQNSIELERRAELFNYPMMIRYQMGKPDFKVSENYPDAFKNLDLNNEKFLVIPIYGQVVLNYVYIKNSEKMQTGKYADMPTEMLVTLDSMVTNKKVKEFMASQAGIQLIENSKTPEKFYTQYISMVKDEVYLKPVRDKYVAMKSMEKGMPSPDFSFADMSGKMFSLKDFKGKYIYIDVWATWCGPCKVEIPYLKTLEEELHDKNIAFVSICTFDEKSKWEVMVKEKDLKGTQLFAPRDNDFVKKYNIQGIPRFLIIDKEGKILDSNSKRPSDPTLKDDLLKLP